MSYIDELPYLYGKLNKEVEPNTYKGGNTDTAATTIDNGLNVITVDVNPSVLLNSVKIDTSSNEMVFSSRLGTEISRVQLSGFQQEQSNLAETDIASETFVKNKSTRYLSNEGANGNYVYAEIAESDLQGGHFLKWDSVNKIISDGGTLNIENGEGIGSLVQKRLKSDGVTWTTAKAYQGAGAAFGGGTQAGRTEEEFNAYFWDSTNNIPLNGGQGKTSEGEVKDNRGLTYSKSYSYGFAEGETTKAYGRGSHSEGSGTQAIGEYSHTEGYISQSAGDASHSEGWNAKANGRASHSEGEGTRAEAVGSHAEGSMTKAKAPYSHAEGVETESQGTAAHSEGQNTKAIGNNSHVEGDTTTANGLASHSEGRETKTNGNYSHVEGYKAEVRNVAYTAPTGGGSGSGVTGGDDEQPDFNAEEHRGEGSHAEGILTISSGYSSHAEGAKTVADGMYSHAEGLKTYAKGNYSHAEGLDTSAVGENSHAESSATIASGTSSHAEGRGTKAMAENSHAEGSVTITSGANAHAEGSATIASGENSHAEGTYSKASGISSHAEGWYTRAANNFQHVEGRFNADNPNALHIVGNGTSDTDRKNAFEVLDDGRAKVQSAPVDNDDIVRKIELNTLDTKINELYVSQEMAATLF